MLVTLFHVEHMFTEKLIVHSVVSFEYFLAEVDGEKGLDFGPEVADFVFEGSFV